MATTKVPILKNGDNKIHHNTSPKHACIVDTKLLGIVTGIATKRRLSWNMVPNINPCENEWSNISENLRVVAIKLFELTQFASSNLSINCNFSCDKGDFPSQSINREVYAWYNFVDNYFLNTNENFQSESLYKNILDFQELNSQLL